MRFRSASTRSGLGTLSGSIDQPGEVTTLKVVAPASGSMTVAQLSSAEGNFTGYLVVTRRDG